jgi:hypothetical protein
MSLQILDEPPVKNQSEIERSRSCGLHTRRGQKTSGNRMEEIMYPIDRLQNVNSLALTQKQFRFSDTGMPRTEKVRLAAAERRLIVCDAPLCHSQRATKNSWNFARAPSTN